MVSAGECVFEGLAGEGGGRMDDDENLEERSVDPVAKDGGMKARSASEKSARRSCTRDVLPL